MIFSLLSTIFTIIITLAAAAPIADADGAPIANAVAVPDLVQTEDQEYFLYGYTNNFGDTDKWKVVQCGGSGEQLCACDDGTCGSGVKFWLTFFGVIYTKYNNQETPHVYLTWDDELHLVMRTELDTTLNPLSVHYDFLHSNSELYVNEKNDQLWICPDSTGLMHLTLFTGPGDTEGCKNLHWRFTYY